MRHDGVVVAVLAKDTSLAVTRSPSTLELTYLDIAADLCLMVSAGTFPPQKLQDAEMSPRVGDSLAVRLDGREAGLVRQPERAVGLPADRRCRRHGRRRPRRAHPQCVGRPGGGRGGRSRDLGRAVGPVPRSHGRQGVRDDVRRGPPAAAAEAAGGARWCSCGTSPTSAAATVRCSRRTPRSARSTIR